MGQAISGAARKLLAVAVLVVAAFVLFKIGIGVVASIAWIVVAIVAVTAVIWALRVLLPSYSAPSYSASPPAGSGGSREARSGSGFSSGPRCRASGSSPRF